MSSSLTNTKVSKKKIEIVLESDDDTDIDIDDEQDIKKSDKTELKNDENELPHLERNRVKHNNEDFKVTRVVKIKRKDGKVVQDCDLYIGRACNMGGWKLKQSKWHNPFSLKEYKDIDKVLELYEKHVRSQKHLMNSLEELRGKVLGCWCKNKPTDKCHGDVLVKLLNEKKQDIINENVTKVTDVPVSNLKELFNISIHDNDIITEPFWKVTKLEQVEGRVIRLKSDTYLPNNEQFKNEVKHNNSNLSIDIQLDAIIEQDKQKKINVEEYIDVYEGITHDIIEGNDGRVIDDGIEYLEPQSPIASPGMFTGIFTSHDK